MIPNHPQPTYLLLREPAPPVLLLLHPQGAPGKTSVPYIDISSIDRITKRIGDTRGVDADTAPTRARQWVQVNDVLVSMTRPNLNAVAMVPKDLDGAVASTGFDVLRVVEVLPSWAYYRVQSLDFVTDVCQDLQGVVYPAVRPDDVRRHRLPIPPLPEQRRIVTAIETHFTRLDATVETLKRVQANLKRYRATVLKAAVEGRLVPTEAELARREGRDYEPASKLLERILAERRQRWAEAELAKMRAKGEEPKNDRWRAKYREAVTPDTRILPALPQGWCWSSLDQLAFEVRNGCSRAPSETDGVPILRISSVRPMSVDLEDVRFLPYPTDQYESSLLKSDDLLFTRYNGNSALVGVCGRVSGLNRDLVHPDKLIRVRVSTLVEPAYVEVASNAGQSRAHIEVRTRTTAGQSGVSGRDIKTMPIPLPPQAEQHRLVAEVERLWSVAGQIESTVQKKVLNCTRLKQSILKWAFEGKLVDQDPNDEPAVVLLDRIRAERQAKGKIPRGSGRRDQGCGAASSLTYLPNRRNDRGIP